MDFFIVKVSLQVEVAKVKFFIQCTNTIEKVMGKDTQFYFDNDTFYDFFLLFF